jgi:hypothetical protein
MGKNLMDWSAQLDGYCERLDFTFWAEPLNAMTNLAFLIAAFVMWRRVKGQGMPLAVALTVILAIIGIGSFLFHTFATHWASTADVLPILVFILVYVYIANFAYWGFGVWAAIGLTGLFIPYAAATVPIFNGLGFLGSSAGYAPVPLLIYAYGILLRKRLPEVAKGLIIGATILVVSLAFRTIDEPICSDLPMGTHFIWHILNAIMLAWMIEVYRRHIVLQQSPKEAS